MTMAQVAKLLGLDTTRYSRIESGSYRCSPENAAILLKAYGRDDPETLSAIIEATENSLVRGWWDAYEEALSPKLRDFIALEHECTELRVHNGVLIPGLLQVPEYARDIMELRIRADPDHPVEAYIAVRQARKAVLTRSDAPKVHAIFPEVALVRAFGTENVLRSQVRHLIDLAHLPNLTLSMVPLNARNRAMLNSNFSLMSFTHPWPVTAYMEHDRGGEFLDGPRDVNFVERDFQELTQLTLDKEQTVHRLNQYLEGSRP